MVAMCLASGMDKEFIQNIRTCYDSQSHKGCGKCRPCLNKAVALINNNIYQPGLFDEEITYESIETLYEEVISRIDEGDNLPAKYVAEIERARTILRQEEK